MKRYYHILVFLIVVSSYFQNSAIGDIIPLGLSLVLTAHCLLQRFERPYIATEFLVLLLPIVYGLVLAVNSNSYPVFKDAFLFAIPCVLLIAGSVTMNVLSWEEYGACLIMAGTTVSLLVMAEGVRSLGMTAVLDPFAARYINENPIGNPAPALAIALLIYRSMISKITIGWGSGLLLSVNGLGLYMCASRTYIVILLLFCAVGLIYRFGLRRVALSSAASGLVIVFAMTFLEQPVNDMSFLGKVMHSTAEVSGGGYDGIEDIVLRYRGYESNTAFRQFQSEDGLRVLLGRLGAHVDLQVFLNLGGTEFRYIPLFHNGYIFLLLKSGVVGLMIFCTVFGLIIIRFGYLLFVMPRGSSFGVIASMLVSGTIALMFCNYVVYSFFNCESAVLLINTGYCFAVAQNLTVHNEAHPALSLNATKV
ncbi:hypothetical protein WBG78_30355 [Chryseolinea sp. T2]|uniref:hypothetical protein n=1 Tax=Chryseolinea sp. T2 TaxID=3129255 RepID=UPI003076A00F